MLFSPSCSSRYILGSEVELLEDKLAGWLGTRYAVGCNSGFGAHLLGLLSLGIGIGKRVAVPAFAPSAYIGTVIRQGAEPVLVDTAHDDFHMSPRALEKVLNSSIDAIVVHHLFGGAADMPSIMSLSEDIPVVEVLNYSLGSHIGGAYAGTFGALATSCLREETALGAYGDAGMVWTSRPELNEKLRRIRQENSSGSMHEDYVSGNFHQDTIHAAILLRKFEDWRRALGERRRRFIYLADAIHEQGIEEVCVPEFYHHDSTYFVIFAERRDALIAYLQSAGIQAKAWWAVPVYRQPGLRCLGYKKGDFPQAERAAERS